MVAHLPPTPEFKLQYHQIKEKEKTKAVFQNCALKKYFRLPIVRQMCNELGMHQSLLHNQEKVVQTENQNSS
jgi:hypothetical protein